MDAGAAEKPADLLLPTIQLGRYEVTRLIIGGNPIYGHSHFNRILSQSMTTWHTPERVVDLLKQCERRGINTWQNSYADRTLSDLDRYRTAGGTMHWHGSVPNESFTMTFVTMGAGATTQGEPITEEMYLGRK